MKKRFLVLTFLIAFILCLFPTSFALAEDTEPATKSEYYKIDNDQTIFYQIIYNQEIKIFYLPKTYFCKFIETIPNSEFVKVSYKGIEGYIKPTVQKAYNKDVTDKNAYLDIYVQFLADTDIVDGASQSYSVQSSEKAIYLGERFNTKNEYAIWYKEKICFVDSTKVTKPNIVDFKLPAGPTPPITDGTPPVEPENNLLRVLLIIGICIPSVIIIFLLFKPVKKSEYETNRNRNFSHDDYYDEYRDRHHHHKR